MQVMIDSQRQDIPRVDVKKFFDEVNRHLDLIFSPCLDRFVVFLLSFIEIAGRRFEFPDR